MEGLVSFAVLWPFAGAAFTWLLGRETGFCKNEEKKERATEMRRNFGAAVTVTAELLAVARLILYLPGVGQVHWPDICGMGLSFVTGAFRSGYALVTAFLWFVSTLFSFSYMKSHHHQNRYYFFLLLTLGATVGIFLSADFFTMFVFFEIMSFASYVWVAQDEKKESLRAAETYLAIAVAGGLCILMGMFLLYGETGTLSASDGLFGNAAAQKNGGGQGRVTAAGILMLLGFGAKAGAVPLHIWLPKAHPVAPAPVSALLSGVLTKTGVFGIMLLVLQLFWGKEVFGGLILALGVLTMVTGAVLALFSLDLKRTLACSTLSQIGFILIGLGLAGIFGSRLAGPVQLYQGIFPLPVENPGEGDIAAEGYLQSLGGMLLHMGNHSLIKLLLFCVSGVVLLHVHEQDLNAVRGFGRKKPLLHLLFLSGALGLSGVPLFNGYVSKSLLHEGLLLWQEVSPSLWGKGAEWLFTFSGGLTAAYLIKLYMALFWEKNRDQERQAAFDGKRQYMSRLTALLLSLTALLFPAIGIGGGIQRGLFAWEALFGSFLSLAIGALVYLLVVRRWMIRKGVYVDRRLPKRDLEEGLYRPLLRGLGLLLGVVCRLLDRLPDYLVVGLRKSIYKDSPLPHELEEGDAFTHAVGTVLDGGKRVLNRTIRKKHPVKVSFEHRLAMLSEEIRENNTMISRSLSFGLLLFCIGLVCTLLYMLCKVP